MDQPRQPGRPLDLPLLFFLQERAQGLEQLQSGAVLRTQLTGQGQQLPQELRAAPRSGPGGGAGGGGAAFCSPMAPDSCWAICMTWAMLLGSDSSAFSFSSSSDTAAPPPYFCRLSPIRCTRAAPWGVLMMP